MQDILKLAVLLQFQKPLDTLVKIIPAGNKDLRMIRPNRLAALTVCWIAPCPAGSGIIPQLRSRASLDTFFPTCIFTWPPGREQPLGPCHDGEDLCPHRGFSPRERLQQAQ